jgi:Mg2+ and Co2+ transporter CorA
MKKSPMDIEMIFNCHKILLQVRKDLKPIQDLLYDYAKIKKDMKNYGNELDCEEYLLINDIYRMQNTMLDANKKNK